MRIALMMLLAVPAGATSWPHFRRDAARTGYARETVAPPLTLRWTYQIPGEILSSPVVAYDRVFIGSRSGSVYAFEATTGKLVWEYSTDHWIDATPSVADGRVFVPSRDGKLYAFDAGNGTLLWTFDLAATNLASPIVHNGEVYLPAGYPQRMLYVFDAVTGAVRRSAALPNQTASSPVIDAANGRVFLGTGDGKYSAFDLDLVPAWSGSIQTQGSIYYATPALANGKLLAAPGDDDRSLHAYDPATAAEVWASDPLVGSPSEISLAASVAVSTTTAFVGSACSPHCLWAVDLSTGGKKWGVPLGASSKAGIASSPAVLNDMLYVLSPQGELVAIHTSTGGVQARINLGAEGLSSPAVANGWVYAGTMGGKLYAFESARTWSLSSPDTLLSIVEGTVTVKGTVASPSLTGYTLEWGRGASPDSWTTLATGTDTVVRSTLAVWNTNDLEVTETDDTFTLRLSVNEAGGIPVAGQALYTFSIPQGKVQSVDASSGVTVGLADGTEVVVPPGALELDDTLTVKKLFPGSYPETGIPIEVVATDIVREFTFGGTGPVVFKVPVTIKLPYPSGQFKREEALRIYFFDESAGKWEIVNTSKVNKEENRIWADVRHFTKFRVMQFSPLAEVLNAAQVYSYPNPARGNRVTFKFLVGETADVEIKIYDVAGDLVKELGLSGVLGGTAGEILWDVNGIASGVYIYHLKANTVTGESASVIKKLAIIH